MTISFFHLHKTHSIDASDHTLHFSSPKKEDHSVKITEHIQKIFSHTDPLTKHRFHKRNPAGIVLNQNAKSRNDFKWNCVKLISIGFFSGVAAGIFFVLKRRSFNASIQEHLLTPLKLDPINILGTIAFASVCIAGSVYFFSKRKRKDLMPANSAAAAQEPVKTVKNPIYALRKPGIPKVKKTPLTHALKNQRGSKRIRRKKTAPSIASSRLRISNVNPQVKRKKHSNLLDQILNLEKKDVERGSDYQWNQNLNKFESAFNALSFDELFQHLDRTIYPFKFKDSGRTLKIIDTPAIIQNKTHFKIRFKRPVSCGKFIILENHLMILDDSKSKKILYLIDLSKFGINGQEKMQKDHFSLGSDGKHLLIQLEEVIT